MEMYTLTIWLCPKLHCLKKAPNIQKFRVILAIANILWWIAEKKNYYKELTRTTTKATETNSIVGLLSSIKQNKLDSFMQIRSAWFRPLIVVCFVYVNDDDPTPK